MTYLERARKLYMEAAKKKVWHDTIVKCHVERAMVLLFHKQVKAAYWEMNIAYDMEYEQSSRDEDRMAWAPLFRLIEECESQLDEVEFLLKAYGRDGLMLTSGDAELIIDNGVPCIVTENDEIDPDELLRELKSMLSAKDSPETFEEIIFYSLPEEYTSYKSDWMCYPVKFTIRAPVLTDTELSQEQKEMVKNLEEVEEELNKLGWSMG